jgi:hypothetical protein
LNRPSIFPKLPFDLTIPDHIRLELCAPEINPGLGHIGESAPRVVVPETTMNQKNRPVARENYIRLARKVGSVKPVSIPHTM